MASGFPGCSCPEPPRPTPGRLQAAKPFAAPLRLVEWRHPVRSRRRRNARETLHRIGCEARGTSPWPSPWAWPLNRHRVPTLLRPQQGLRPTRPPPPHPFAAPRPTIPTLAGSGPSCRLPSPPFPPSKTWHGRAATSTASSFRVSRPRACAPWRTRTPGRWRDGWRSTSPGCRRTRTSWTRSWPVPRPLRGRPWWTGCWRRVRLASVGDGIGSTSRAMAKAPARNATTPSQRHGGTATGSSRPWRRTCPTTTSSAAKSPATCSQPPTERNATPTWSPPAS